MINLSNNIGPYMGVSMDSALDFPDVGLSFRVVIYGAFNALGLIGSEGNGIAIFENTRRYVVLDEHCKQVSGYFGPDQTQLDEFKWIMALDWEGFRVFVNNHKRSRWMYGADGTPTGIRQP